MLGQALWHIARRAEIHLPQKAEKRLHRVRHEADDRVSALAYP